MIKIYIVLHTNPAVSWSHIPQLGKVTWHPRSPAQKFLQCHVKLQRALLLRSQSRTALRQTKAH